MEMADNAKAYEGMAICSVNLRDYATALNSANQALALDPSLVSPHLALADVYHHQRKYVEAEAEINKAVELDPNSANVIFAQGVHLLWKKEYNEAASLFIKAIEADPNSTIICAAHVNLGYLHQHRKEFKQALREYQQAYELRPSKGLFFTIWTIKFSLPIAIVLGVLLLVVLVSGFVLKSSLLLAAYLLFTLLGFLALMVNYAKDRKYIWLLIAAFISIVFGWFLYRILYTYFTK
jgi:tetratricopeptide (TPR) repeat protein